MVSLIIFTHQRVSQEETAGNLLTKTAISEKIILRKEEKELSHFKN